jgi:RNA polymerase-binding transcription factor DksA
MIIAAIVPQTLAKSDGVSPSGIKPYKGLIGSDSPFYGLKLFLQNADVSLTGNASERLHKQLAYGRERLEEAYAMSLTNNTGALDAALDEYVNEIEDINDTMDDENIDDIIDMVDRALQKIDQGSYGVCDRCGREISKGRLDALPYAVYCIDCQDIVEGR